jgi:Zn-dependent peptidase ImmA (M78 family)
MYDIKKLANSLAKKYQSRNPFEIIQGMNVILVLAPLIDVRGFYQYFQRNNIIYIDELLPEHERKFVCAHELGHMLMHRKENTVFMDTRTYLKTTPYEAEADKFAVELLVPNEIILENWKSTTKQLSRITGYSEKLIKLRIK